MSQQHLLPLAFLLLSRAAATCYFPDGDISPYDTPCNPLANASVCCFTGQACLSNELCQADTDGVITYARGTCTDQSWKSPDCPEFCLDQ